MVKRSWKCGGGLETVFLPAVTRRGAELGGQAQDRDAQNIHSLDGTKNHPFVTPGR